jgi:hypothetical protein
MHRSISVLTEWNSPGETWKLIREGEGCEGQHIVVQSEQYRSCTANRWNNSSIHEIFSSIARKHEW